MRETEKGKKESETEGELERGGGREKVEGGREKERER